MGSIVGPFLCVVHLMDGSDQLTGVFYFYFSHVFHAIVGGTDQVGGLLHGCSGFPIRCCTWVGFQFCLFTLISVGAFLALPR